MKNYFTFHIFKCLNGFEGLYIFFEKLVMHTYRNFIVCRIYVNCIFPFIPCNLEYHRHTHAHTQTYVFILFKE